MDDNAHGTHCAGTIAGTDNNNIGVSGVTSFLEKSRIQIMALKFLSATTISPELGTAFVTAVIML